MYIKAQDYEVNSFSRDFNMDTLVGFYACDVLIIAIPPSDEYLDVYRFKVVVPFMSRRPIIYPSGKIIAHDKR